jgi:hypothetical protein
MFNKRIKSFVIEECDMMLKISFQSDDFYFESF